MAIAVLVWFGVMGIKSSLESIGRLYVPNASRRRRIVQRAVTAGHAAGVAGLLLWAGQYFRKSRHDVPGAYATIR